MILGLLKEFARNREDADDVLVLSKTFKQIANVGTSRLATSERCFPGLQAVDAPLVGEDKETIFTETSRDELRRVFAFCGDAFQTSTAPVLGSEGLDGRVPDVVVFTQRDDDRSLLDEVFTVH